MCEVTCVFLSIRLCLLTHSPRHQLLFSAFSCGSLSTNTQMCAMGVPTLTHACLLSASECHMPPNFAENRKPHQLEGSPVIHQEMTVRLLVPVLRGGVTVQGSFLPCLPVPGQWWSRAGLDFVLSPLETAWPDSVGAKFLFIFPDFFGVGRLRNVECCNRGGGRVEKREPAILPCSSFSPRCLWRPLAPLGSQAPSPSLSHCHIVSLQQPGPGRLVLATPQALATVVASSCLKQLCGLFQKWL